MALLHVDGCEAERFGDEGHGDNGLFGDKLGDFFKDHLLGDLERDLLRDLTADVTST